MHAKSIPVAAVSCRNLDSQSRSGAQVRPAPIQEADASNIHPVEAT